MKMIINGQKVDSSDGRTQDVVNPATLQVIDTVPSATAEDITKAVDGAVAAQEAWAALPVRERCVILRRDLKKQEVRHLASHMRRMALTRANVSWLAARISVAVAAPVSGAVSMPRLVPTAFSKRAKSRSRRAYMASWRISGA